MLKRIVLNKAEMSKWDGATDKDQIDQLRLECYDLNHNYRENITIASYTDKSLVLHNLNNPD